MHVDKDSGHPRLYVHPRCKNLIWELGRYTFKERSKQTRDLNPHEMAVDKDDHACSALRYMVMTRPSAARIRKRKKPPRWSFESWLKQVDGPKNPGINPTQV